MVLKLKKNEVINNNYKIGEMIGEGGMSVVYRAEDLKHKKDVALKFLKQGVTSSYVEDVIRFKREAEAVSKLDHPNVIKLYEAGEYNNTPYLAEELLKGKSLAELLQQGKMFTFGETVQIIAQVVEALDYVHKRRIIHRDLKPGNIVVVKKGDKYAVTLLDFGIAHIMELSRIKEVTQIVGTFGYMSPEATGIVNKQIDERSDFYSLGVVFYQLLAKELPFKSTEVNKLLHEQVAVEPRRLREVNRQVPKILEEIVIKLLNKEPELRYQSAVGLLHDLKMLLKGKKDFIIAEKDQKTKLTYQTRLVGREEEVEILKSSFQKAKESQGNICLIGGEPGVGKSRLVGEMKEYLYEQGYEGGGLFIQGRCLNQENKIPYQPFRDSINEYIQKLEKMKDNDRKKEVERLKEVVGDLGEIIIKLNPHMKEILGDVPPLVTLDSERENQRFQMVASDFFCHLTEKGKLSVLFLDDLQWADEGSLGLLNELTFKISNTNTFIIGTYRDDEVGKDHSLQKIRKKAEEKKSSISDIRLTKLNHERLNRMVAGVLGEQAEKAEKLTGFILEKSGGNPFFAITILRELVEEKALTWKDGYWQEDWEKINAIRISNNIIDLVIKRIDDLTADQNKLLCVSSIIGREFKVDLLYTLLEFEEEEIIRLIDELMMVQLIEKSKDKGKVIFVHDRIREAFLEKIGKKESKKIHLDIAKVIEENNKDNLDQVIFDLAFHYSEAENKEKALEYLFPAAEKAKENYANDEAIRYYTKTITALEETGRKSTLEWLQAKEGLADVYLTVGNNEEAIKISNEILPLKKDILEKARIFRKIGTAYYKMGDWNNCESTLAKGLKIL
ncbi:MAG: protein kinase, partial [Spirochaetes bacterium]|nr:protein kinase [Spirochaetota bacterium]